MKPFKEPYIKVLEADMKQIVAIVHRAFSSQERLTVEGKVEVFGDLVGEFTAFTPFAAVDTKHTDWFQVHVCRRDLLTPCVVRCARAFPTNSFLIHCVKLLQRLSIKGATPHQRRRFLLSGIHFQDFVFAFVILFMMDIFCFNR